ncbi:MAG: iron ABC transporter substrate-binding protein [Chloroflexia bacterium]|nr:iron ABC transporter substrate-binding protein [Chloroflexia bacterium]
MPLLAACGGDDEDDPTVTTATGAGSTPDFVPGEATSTDDPTATAGGDATETGESTPAADGTPGSESPGATTVEPGSLEGQEVTVYSGRSEELVDPILRQFEELSGATVRVQYADTAELAATILEEGDNSPADIFFAQDAGALGAIADEGMFVELPQDILDMVDPRFRSDNGQWVGISGRARAIVYNTENLSEADIPESILDFTDPAWDGRLGWAPTNGSFQAFITALRVLEGDDVAREWLEGIQANNPKVYSGNTPILEAAMSGEIDAGFVNHYYLYRALEEAGGEITADNYIYTNGTPGALINVAGAGMLSTSENTEAAEALLRFLLSEEAQRYFADETFEYPLVTGVEADPRLVPLEDIQTPDIDLSQLEDLEGTLELLTDVGVL